MTTLTPGDKDTHKDEHGRREFGRRRFVGYLVAAPTLAVAVRLGLDGTVAEEPAAAVVPGVPEPADLYDLSDLLTDAALPTSGLISITVHTDGTASFAIPRAEVGQGITTAAAMLIADEMDLPMNKVRVTLADSRPELLFNQLTGGSNTMHAMYHPIRTAAAVARNQLVNTAAAQWNVSADQITTRDGVVYGPSSQKATYGSLATASAVSTTRTASVQLKDASAQTIVGTARRRIDAHAAVTGRKKFAMDLKVPGALPTMVCRPPTINGKVGSVDNRSTVLNMPGVTHVAVISTGVAVRAKTFGQCINAVRALKVTWKPGTVDAESDATIAKRLKDAEVPLAVPQVPVLAKTFDAKFTFHFRSNSALEPNSAVADVRSDSATIWSSLKVPIVVQQGIAQSLGLPQDAVKVHITEGGGSFGRHLFGDVAYEAAEASRAFGNKPVRLMWHRTDEFRQGRTHPMCTSRVRATVLANEVLTFEQRHTSVATDFTHGLGEILTSFSSKLPGGALTFSESIFELSANVPYNYGVTTQVLNEILDYDTIPTGSMRNVYSPDVCTAIELVTDQIAASMKKDPVAFRKEFAKDDRMRAVIEKVASVGKWGRSMPAGTAQGIAIHSEYKGRIATLVEIDCRPATVDRKVRDGWTGPRVTKVVTAVDVGLPINPLGLKAQMMGGAMDGIAQTLTSSMHLKDGTFLEGSWDNYFYTRQWNTPPEVEIIVMPPTTGVPGGAGEFGVGVAQAAVACAYARATGKMPTSFPINHQDPLGFEVLPTVPSIPQSPTDGLKYTY
ncbi:MAG TPA: molybdopterin cofactor-binding domain-containing protein [Nocardioides sp.]|nr:molybdopterin cofactor-binding domain-containing protein [Nocardioides sp.]